MDILSDKLEKSYMRRQRYDFERETARISSNSRIKCPILKRKSIILIRIVTVGHMMIKTKQFITLVNVLSSSSCHAISTDIPDPLSPSLPIVH